MIWEDNEINGMGLAEGPGAQDKGTEKFFSRVLFDSVSCKH
jgi:hypothetical protein